MNGWTKIKGAKEYAGIKDDRTLRLWMRQDLRYARLPSGTLLFSYQWLDEFLMSFEVTDTKAEKIDKIVKEVMEEL